MNIPEGVVYGEIDPVRVIDGETAIVHGWATVPYLNEMLGVALPTDGGFETIAGLIQARTGELPDEGDRIEIASTTLTVLDATNTRIRRVRIERGESVSSEGSPDDGEPDDL